PLESRYTSCFGRMTKPPAYPFRYLAMSNSRENKPTAAANLTWRTTARPSQLMSRTQLVKATRATRRSDPPEPPGPSPVPRPRRSVKRYLGRGAAGRKQNLQEIFAFAESFCQHIEITQLSGNPHPPRQRPDQPQRQQNRDRPQNQQRFCRPDL